MFYLLIFAIIGYIVGAKLALLIQLGFIVVWVIYLASQKSFTELAVIFPIAAFLVFMFGLIVGDITFAISYPELFKFNAITDAIKWALIP